MILILFQHAYPSTTMLKLTVSPGEGWFLSCTCFLAYLSLHFIFEVKQRWKLLESTHTNQCQCFYTLKNPLPLEPLGLNVFEYPWTYQVSYMFLPPALVPLTLSNFLADHVTGQFRILILVAPCWMEAPWLPTVLSMLEDIPHQFPI